MTDAVRLHDIPTVPDMQIGLYGERQETDTWRRIDLLDDQYRNPPDPPSINGLLYAGRRHVLSGPPESTKTLIAYHLLLAAQREGHGTAIIDLEMGPHAAVTLLRELGATDEEISRILYFEPNEPPHQELAQHLTVHGVTFVLIDAAAGAYSIHGLDDNARKDVEQFARAWTQPLWQTGMATIVIDHVTKNADTRGKFTIGSERKLGGADVHLGLEALKPLSRGHTGMVRVTVHKDRPGHLPRPTAVMVDLASDPNTHHVTVNYRDPHPVDEEGTFKPTIYMEKVSRQLEKFPDEPKSQSWVEEHVKGTATYIRDALEWLVRDEYLAIDTGPRNAKMYTLVRPYKAPENTPQPTPQPTPSEPRRHPVATTPSDPVAPRRALTGPRDGVDTAPTDNPVDPETDAVNVYDPAVQALLDDDDRFPTS